MAPLSFSASTKGDTALVSLTHCRPAYNHTDSPSRVAPVDLDVSIDDGTLRLTMPPHSFATVELALG